MTNRFFLLLTLLNFIGISKLASADETSMVNAPSRREGHSVTVVENKVFIWGGRTLVQTGETEYEGQLLNDGKFFEPDSNIWRDISKVNAPSPRKDHFSHYLDGKIYIWGGCSRLGPTCENFAIDGGVFDIADNSWVAIPDFDLKPLYPKKPRNSTTITGNELVHFARSYDNPAKMLAAKYNFNTQEWTVSNSNFPFVNDFGHTWEDQKYITFNKRKIGVFDLKNNIWEMVSQTEIGRRGYGLTVDSDVLYILDGECRVEPTKVLAYNLNRETWHKLPNLPRPGCLQRLVSGGGKLFSFGRTWYENCGPNCERSKKTNELFEFDFVNKRWKLLTNNTHEGIYPIDYLTVTPVIANGEFIVWGGKNAGIGWFVTDRGVRF